eukprot:5299390-Pleurochrysis_carterae.AAC.2
MAIGPTPFIHSSVQPPLSAKSHESMRGPMHERLQKCASPRGRVQSSVRIVHLAMQAARPRRTAPTRASPWLEPFTHSCMQECRTICIDSIHWVLLASRHLPE